MGAAGPGLRAGAGLHRGPRAVRRGRRRLLHLRPVPAHRGRAAAAVRGHRRARAALPRPAPERPRPDLHPAGHPLRLPAGQAGRPAGRGRPDRDRAPGRALPRQHPDRRQRRHLPGRPPRRPGPDPGRGVGADRLLLGGGPGRGQPDRPAGGGHGRPARGVPRQLGPGQHPVLHRPVRRPALGRLPVPQRAARAVRGLAVRGRVRPGHPGRPRPASPGPATWWRWRWWWPWPPPS